MTRSGVVTGTIDALADKISTAHHEMAAIESGTIKNPDEHRQVTHFTDRVPYLESALFKDVNQFFEDIRAGAIRTPDDACFESVVFNGIGGSALGPQLVHMALNGPHWNEAALVRADGGLRIYFLDNTDAAGITDMLDVVDLKTLLSVTISKSGSTQETLNNLSALERLYNQQGITFGGRAAAITMADSRLDRHARDQGWLKRWNMAESIGGRTSVTSVVGHVPAAAAGIDFGALLAGAVSMDQWTRNADVYANPAYLLAVTWYILGNARGDRNMVIIPYSDRLILLSRYLQQLVMESLGKRLDRTGATVHQGLNVFGNKGGTDAHAFVQQLNDGRDDFFVTFIELLRDHEQIPLDNDMTMGDYLHNFLQGLTNALHSQGRRVITISLNKLDAASLGMLIALYERAVAFYAELINVNAFHQPGVQAYKLAADETNALSGVLRDFIADNAGFVGTASDVAAIINNTRVSEIDGILSKFAENDRVFRKNTVRRDKDGDQWHYHIDESVGR